MQPHSTYQEFVKPRLVPILDALGLNVNYHRAQGNYLYYDNAQGEEQQVVDFLGGYGATLLGHNHPRIIEAALERLQQQRPQHAQFSRRDSCGALAQKLSQIVAARMQQPEGFKTIFANSGAEGVEAAIKHAELVRVKKVQTLVEDITRNLKHIEQACHQQGLTIPKNLFAHSAQGQRFKSVEQIDTVLAALIEHNVQQLYKAPHYFALTNAFHGKLMGSVQLTFGELFRKPFQYFGLNSQFMTRNDCAALDQYQLPEAVNLYDLTIEAGQLKLVEQPVPLCGAMIVEPLQGEGGIHALTPEFATAVRRFCNRFDMPLIVDEIQCGMGRTGTFFASEQIGLKGDYYVLSKALGGGLAKISATLVRDSLYDVDFSLIHSSTFAEDDFACHIASCTLDILLQDDHTLRHIDEIGSILKQQLCAIAADYPDVIREIRGQGLMLGIEFCSQEQASSLIIRGSAYSKSLGYMMSGYLLQQFGIRCAPPASQSNVLRIEPSMLIQQADVDQFCHALQQLCQVMRYQDALHLIWPLCGQQRAKPRNSIQDFREQGVQAAELKPAAKYHTKVAFVNHLITPDWLSQVDPSLQQLNSDEMRTFVLKMDVNKTGAPYPPVRIHSPLGSSVDFILYPLCVSSEQMTAYLTEGNMDEIRDAVTDRVQAAQQDGCTVAGLGMYTSIVSNNCTALQVSDIALTSGNALTIGMGIQAIERALQQQSRELSQQHLAVIGAAGNIASTYASILAEEVASMTLVGSQRSDSVKRLQKTAHKIYQSAWDDIQANPQQAWRGIIGQVRELAIIKQWLNAPETCPKQAGRAIAEAIVQLHQQDPFIRLSQSLDDVAQADIVLCAANSATPILFTAHFKQDAIVCDIAVPHNVHPDVLNARPDITYMQGGIVATPNGESLAPQARAYLGAGEIYACMAESVVMGLSRQTQHYSYGDISKQQVREIAQLAQIHGLRLSDFKQSASL